jgi:hypothetical protein
VAAATSQIAANANTKVTRHAIISRAMTRMPFILTAFVAFQFRTADGIPIELLNQLEVQLVIPEVSSLVLSVGNVREAIHMRRTGVDPSTVVIQYPYVASC